VAAYPIALDASNLPDALTFTVPQRGIRTALKLKRDGNGRYTTGSGARRGSSYEHQLDRIDDLATLAGIQGHVIVLETGHGRRRKQHHVYVYELLSAAARSTQRWQRVYVRKIDELIRWLTANHPAVLGWAHRQSRARTRRDPSATRFALPRRAWTTFTLYRRAYDLAVRMILTLQSWSHRGGPVPSRAERAAVTGDAPRPERAIPSPRVSSPRTESEERTHEVGEREQAPDEVQGSHDDWRAVVERVGRRFLRFFTT
jgi:hypothetical protein